MFGRNKPKYKVILLKSIGKNEYVFQEEKGVNLNKDIVLAHKDKEKAIPLTQNCFQYRKDTTYYAFIDIDECKIIMLKDVKLGISSGFLDKLLSTSKVGIIGQWMSVLKADMKEPKTDWGSLGKPLVIFIVGCALGYFMAGGTI